MEKEMNDLFDSNGFDIVDQLGDWPSERWNTYIPSDALYEYFWDVFWEFAWELDIGK